MDARRTRKLIGMVALGVLSAVPVSAARLVPAPPPPPTVYLPPEANASLAPTLSPTVVGPVISAPPSRRPLLALRAVPVNYTVGRGLVGQPKVFVPGQPVRNFVRYFTP